MLAKSYVAGIPGAGILVDTAFDQVEGIVDAHRDEARAILKTAMEDIQNAVKAHGADPQAAAWDVLIILRDKLGQIQASASEAGQNRVGPLFENFHGFREHANQRIPEVLASMHSLRSVAKKGLEKARSLVFQSRSSENALSVQGKNFLSEASERRSSRSAAIPSVEETTSSSSVQGKISTQDSPTNQSGGNVA
jgi:hypothetical protein